MIFTILSFDNYDYNNNNFQFCYFCFYYIKKLNIPKFDITNIVNIGFCQDYLNVFKDFTLVEKVVITFVYLVISIIKLKPNSISFVASYYSYAIIFL